MSQVEVKLAEILRIRNEMKITIKKILETLFDEEWRRWRIYAIYKKIKSPNPNSSRYWNYKLSKYDSFWRNENYHNVIHLLPKDREFSLLDVGCALGDGVEFIQKKLPKAKITGIDHSAVGIKKALEKENEQIKFFTLDIIRDDLPDVYDFITIIQTLEHFDDPFFVLDKCLRRVRTSVIVSVAFSPDYTGKLNRREHRYAFNESTFDSNEYKFRIALISDFMQDTHSKCIIYEFFPKND